MAGSSTARTTVASSGMATERPTPICLNSTSESVPKTAKTATITAAALVTVPAVVRIAWATSSRTRLRMNTW